VSDDLTQFCSPEALLKRSTLAAVNMTIMRLNGEYSKEVWKSNFRQYGEMKSRAGQRQREEED
jgi:predicted metalloenzyme YecM